MRCEIDIRTDDGLRRAREKLQAMRMRAQSPLPAWNAILDWLSDQNRRQFSTQGMRWGNRWDPLSPRTVRNKRNQGYPRNILIRTGELRDQLTRRPFGIERYDVNGATAGTDLEYAVWHQRGTRDMPRRKLLDARRVRAEGVSGRAMISWVVHGDARTQ